MTASMAQLRTMQSGSEQQFWLLKRYLRKNDVPVELSYRVLRYVEYKLASQQNAVPRSRIQVLDTISEQLRVELQCVVEFSGILSHPLLVRMRDISLQARYVISMGG